MVKQSRHLRMMILGAVASVIAVLLVLVAGFRMPTAVAGTIHGSGALADWQFQYTLLPDDDGQYIVSYDYPHASVQEVQAAAAAMNRKAAQLAQSGKPFKATLVFAHPLALDDFMSFAAATGVAPTSSIIRAVDPDKGGVTTLGVPPEFARNANGQLLIGQPAPGGKPLDLEGLKRFTQGSASFRFIGVVSTDVSVDGSTYTKLQQDSRVYALDVMQQVVTDIVQREHPNIAADRIHVQGSVLYAALENSGIAPKPLP
jgi:hypothetical protein